MRPQCTFPLPARQKQKGEKNFQGIITIIAACILGTAFFTLLYQYDNKYITAAEISQDGTVLIPDSQNGNGTPSQEITWLIQGWSFYPDQLICPGDKTGPAESVYIGQYFSFSGFHEDGSPYGTGTYSLKIYGNGNYTILLPEVFSSCEVYIDGKKTAASGSLLPYEPDIKDLVFSFELNGEAEILIQTANYSHYYSGVTYPPAIGSSEAVNRLITIRMLFYGFFVFTSLALFLFTAIVWYGTKKAEASGENFWLWLLCISFSIRLCYPFIHTLGISGGILSYTLENSMAALNLFCIVCIVSILCLKPGSPAECILKGITGGFTLLGLIFPLLLTRFLPGFVSLYGEILFWYKMLTALAMSLLLTRRIFKRMSGQMLLLLTGLLIYSIALIFHALCLGHYEPACTGWFEEWGIYILILCFAARMSLRNMEIIQRNQHLNEHLQEEVAQKTNSLTKLLEERRFILSGLAHDLKTPVTSITTFTRLVELNNTQLDDESREYLNIIRQKTNQIQEQLSTINEFTHIDSAPPAFEPLDLYLLLRDFYIENRPDMDVSGIMFELTAQTDEPVMIYGDKIKLVSVLQNLVFNAMSFTHEGGTISLSLTREQNSAILRVEDNGAGISEKYISRIFDRFFTNRNSGSGMGLFIVKSIITEHSGKIEVSSTLGEGTVFTIRLPLIQ